MEHQARDSGLGLEPEIEQQQQESQLREEVIDEQDERIEELRGPQGELEKLQERQEEVREDRFDQPPGGHTIRIITPSPVEHATQEPQSVVREENRPVRVQSPVLSDAARRERELPRVPVSEESNTDSSAQVNPSVRLHTLSLYVSYISYLSMLLILKQRILLPFRMQRTQIHTPVRFPPPRRATQQSRVDDRAPHH